MNTTKRVLLGIVIGLAIGAILGAAGGLLRNEGLSFYGGLLVAASGAISAGIVAAVLRPGQKHQASR